MDNMGKEVKCVFSLHIIYYWNNSGNFLTSFQGTENIALDIDVYHFQYTQQLCKAGMISTWQMEKWVPRDFVIYPRPRSSGTQFQTHFCWF
jgi:hypothetical protein